MCKSRNEAKKIAKKFITLLNKFITIDSCYLYGSFAKNEKIHKWSDIDIAVVSPDFEFIPFDIAGKMLSKAAKEVSLLIEAIPLSPNEIKAPMLGTIGYTVIKTGIKI